MLCKQVEMQTNHIWFWQEADNTGTSRTCSGARHEGGCLIALSPAASLHEAAYVHQSLILQWKHSICMLCQLCQGQQSIVGRGDHIVVL